MFEIYLLRKLNKLLLVNEIDQNEVHIRKTFLFEKNFSQNLAWIILQGKNTISEETVQIEPL